MEDNEVKLITYKNYPTYITKIQFSNLDKSKFSDKFIEVCKEFENYHPIFIKCDKDGNLDLRKTKDKLEYRIINFRNSGLSPAERLSLIAYKDNSNFFETMKWRQENEYWLDKMFSIAIAILSELDKQKISKEELAEKMDIPIKEVSKMLSGKEDISLSTICKLEMVLNIKLLNVKK